MTKPNLPAGTTALVTGASSGIGKAIAARLIERGCRVVCAGRRLEPLETLCAELDGAAHPLQLDITNPQSVESILSRLPEDWSEIDILVNNAGHDVGGRRRFDEGSADQWASIIETNAIGLMRATHALIPGMIARDRGHVINIGSTAGISAYATGTAYSGSKHAVHGFSDALRLDYAGTGIRVTEILPGLVRTNFAFNRFGQRDKADAFYEAKGKTYLDPDDVARTVLFALEQPAGVVITQLVVVPGTKS